MKARPILFSGPMVCALLAGTKTQTRRVVKPQTPATHGWAGWIISSTHKADEGKATWQDGTDSLGSHHLVRCPYGKPGDLLWVRETCRAKELTTKEAEEMWRASPDYDGLPPNRLYGLDGVLFLADNAFKAIANTPAAGDAWTDLNAYRGKRGATVPPIHMPRWASRLTLRITQVGVQRLQEISEADAIAEGAVGHPDGMWHAYRSLWTLINGPGSWEANPWVWAITFEVIRQNIDAVLAQQAAQ